MTKPQTLAPEDWVTVRVLADATGNTPQAIYLALYDTHDPMPCARNGRAIRVRLCDWRAWWERRACTIQPGSPARAPRRMPRSDDEAVAHRRAELATRAAKTVPP